MQGSSILDTLSSFLGGGSKAKPSDLYQAALHPFMATKGQNNKRQPLPVQSKTPAKVNFVIYPPICGFPWSAKTYPFYMEIKWKKGWEVDFSL